MTDLCAWHECQKPLVPGPGEKWNNFVRRETCGPSCSAKLGQWRAKQTRDAVDRVAKRSVYVPPWPRVTARWPDRWERTKPFKRHNINPGDGGYFHRPQVADTQSYIGCAAAMLVRSAVP